jgi:hypothetical protein
LHLFGFLEFQAVGENEEKPQGEFFKILWKTNYILRVKNNIDRII